MTVLDYPRDSNYTRNYLTVAKWPGISTAMPGARRRYEHTRQDDGVRADAGDDGKYFDETIHRLVTPLLRSAQVELKRVAQVL